jgi:hypothetical protein
LTETPMQVISDGIQFCRLHTPIITKSWKLCAHEHDRVRLLIEDVRVVTLYWPRCNELKSWKPFLSLSYFLRRIHSTQDISHNVFDCLWKTNIKHLVHWVWLGCRARKLMVGSLEWTYLGHNSWLWFIYKISLCI